MRARRPRAGLTVVELPRFNCQDTPKRSLTQAKNLLKPSCAAGIISLPLAPRTLPSRLTSSSEPHSTKNEEGVKEKACRPMLSVRSTACSPIQKGLV
ncbi:hypothetical protein Mnod_4362 [Methylobacterium nodulans ORS 2060]|uniref:Uncharacterized protein n=1 Tax=Methylobacterium nodulans (strain LMG 21967 / CNCM I-2342 / ORS 2060) TaxID=460265 RepID=B8IAH0_METNO|nr:hypothetical protein Mnod_4362 [Methylobacterium nodulans ORS 2060]